MRGCHDIFELIFPDKVFEIYGQTCNLLDDKRDTLLRPVESDDDPAVWRHLGLPRELALKGNHRVGEVVDQHLAVEGAARRLGARHDHESV